MLMDAARSGDDVAFRTAFSDNFDLVQIFRGMNPTVNENHPVDFRLAAHDILHMDHVLSFATDECPPVVINGENIGGQSWPSMRGAGTHFLPRSGRAGCRLPLGG